MYDETCNPQVLRFAGCNNFGQHYSGKPPCCSASWLHEIAITLEKGYIVNLAFRIVYTYRLTYGYK